MLGVVVTVRLPGPIVSFIVPGNTDSHDLGLWKGGSDAAAPSPAAVGLFHVAWRVDRPEALGAFRASLVARGIPVRASMDHGANQSVYFQDPDGHMLEVTYERLRDACPPGRHPFADREPLPIPAARV